MDRKLQIREGKQRLAEAETGGAGAGAREDALERRTMNVAVLKTKAEQALSEGFAGVADALPGGADVAAEREAALGRFSALGLPHRRIEAWKYTDLRTILKDVLPPAVGPAPQVALADLDAALGPFAKLDATRIVFVDGAISPLSERMSVDGMALVPLSSALAEKESGTASHLLRLNGRDDDAVLALNAAYVTDGAVVAIAKGAKLAKPLLIVSVRLSPEPLLITTRNVVSVGEGAEATIIELFLTLPGAAVGGQQNAATELEVGAGARVTHIKATLETDRALHLANWLVDVGAGADYRGFQFTGGAALTRNQLGIVFKGKDARIDVSGAFFARDTEHVDTTLVVDHAVPGCTSRELFKGVLADRGRGVFQGKVIVRPDAQKTDGKQMAQVLMLSPDAEFDSKPELEIFADDVVCGHGSTSTDLDDNLLFYCRSRGIPLEEARALLIESFVGEALHKVERADVREALEALARDWLDQKPSAKQA
jgi:Fe-S cluster assembly protein SufD